MATRSLRLNCRFDPAESRDLKLARDDLRIAANRTMTTVYLADRARQANGTNGVALHTLAYRRVSGIKGQEPAYSPTTPGPVGGGVRSAVATHVYQRYREDRRALERGEKSLATFRRLPLCLRAQEVRLVDNEHLEILVWGKPKPRWVRAQCWPAGRRQRFLWRRVARGEIRTGDLKLQLDRLGRWYAILSYHVDVDAQPTDGGVIGLEVRGSTLSALHLRPDGTRDELEYPAPANFWRLWERWLRWRREAGRTARRDYGVREGRGRRRKLEPLSKRRDRYERRVEDCARVMAGAAVREARRLGAAIAYTRQFGEAKRQQDETEDTRPRETRAELRSRFLRRNRQRIMERLRSAAEREGVTCVEVSGRELGEKPLHEIAVRGIVAVGPDRCPGAQADRPAVAGGKAEEHGRRAASGEVIADSPQALDVSARPGDTSSDRPGSRGPGSTENRGSRKRKPKRRGRRDLRE